MEEPILRPTQNLKFSFPENRQYLSGHPAGARKPGSHREFKGKSVSESVRCRGRKVANSKTPNTSSESCGVLPRGGGTRWERELGLRLGTQRPLARGYALHFCAGLAGMMIGIQQQLNGAIQECTHHTPCDAGQELYVMQKNAISRLSSHELKNQRTPSHK